MNFKLPIIYLDKIINPGQLKFTLTWGVDDPKDLDLHAIFDVSSTTKCHVFFGKPYCLGTSLKRDVFEGGSKGSESIIIDSLGNYKYMIFVGNFYGTQILESNNTNSIVTTNSINLSNAAVFMYSANFQEPVFSIEIPYIPAGVNVKQKNWWLVLCFDGSLGMKSLIRINKLLENEPKFTDCK